jgi:hypothetical protein
MTGAFDMNAAIWESRWTMLAASRPAAIPQKMQSGDTCEETPPLAAHRTSGSAARHRRHRGTMRPGLRRQKPTMPAPASGGSPAAFALMVQRRADEREAPFQHRA